MSAETVGTVAGWVNRHQERLIDYLRGQTQLFHHVFGVAA